MSRDVIEIIAFLDTANAAGQVFTEAELRQFVAEASAVHREAGPGKVTLFYSEELPDKTPAWTSVKELGAANSNVLTLANGKVPVEQLINSGAFQAALDNTVEGPNAVAERVRILTGERPDGTRVPDGLWDDASRRFAESVSGEVRLFAPNAVENSVFGQTELKALLDNPNVTSIDGISRQQLLKLRDGAGGGLAKVFQVLRDNSLVQYHLGGLSSRDFDSYLRLQPADYPEVLKDKAKFVALQEAIRGLDPERLTQLKANARLLMLPDFSSGAGSISKGLNKLSFIGAVLGLMVSGTAAASQHLSGDTEGAKQTMMEWAADAAGSEVGAVIGAAAAGIVLAIAAAGGIAISAPVVGALTFGAAMVGGFFGSDAGVEFVRLLKDRDRNDSLDLFDKLSNVLFGATSTIVSPFVIDLDGQRLTIDASLTADELTGLSKESIAWRFALRELTSFVVTDVDYAPFNSDHSLDLYDASTGEGAMTAEYLRDRAQMLVWKMKFETKNVRDDDDSLRSGPKPYNEDWDTNSIEGNWDFTDLTARLPGGGTAATLHRWQRPQPPRPSDYLWHEVGRQH